MDQDTSPEAQRQYIDLLRSMTPLQRLQAAASLTASARELTRMGIRMRHPGASETEREAIFLEIVYGNQDPRPLPEGS